MAIDFPSSPTNGQIFGNYRYNATDGVWQLLGNVLEVPAVFSNTATGSYTDGYDYDYVSFTSSGTLTVTRGGYADVLLVGGGGGGGFKWGGGGGAGGVLYIENAYLPAGSLDVIVGAGGRTPAGISGAYGLHGDNGLPSSLWKYYAPGGGAGAGYSNSDSTTNNYVPTGGLAGASGGGDNGWNYANPGATRFAGLGVAGIGNDGGAGAYLNGGGGGGASTTGANAVGGSGGSAKGGNGGNGVSNSITGSAVTYGGGGGGCGYILGGTGGTGGGGNGETYSPFTAAVAGTANTGGGGGGAVTGSSVAGAGGSGIVIVRVRTN